MRYKMLFKKMKWLRKMFEENAVKITLDEWLKVL